MNQGIWTLPVKFTTPTQRPKERMKTPTTQTRLKHLIQTDVDAGRKVRWLDIDAADRASLIDEIRNEKGPLAKQMKASGIDVALPTLGGVPIRWRAAVTRTSILGATA
jgi:hypothetical protein